MRKLTGYIGAMIIVFALIGSIFAGYALNVTGESKIINEYENVTDVSGLYTHTQEPSYIDYNPASNYIGYNVEQSGIFTITNTSPLAGGMSYKLYKGSSPNCAWNANHFTDGAFYVNGAVVPFSTTGQHTGLTAYKIVVGDGTDVYVWDPSNNPTVELHINGGRYWSSNFTIAYNNNTLTYTLVDNGNQVLTSSCSWLIMPSANGDYVPVISGHAGYYQNNDVYKEDAGTYTITDVNEWGGMPVYNLYSINNSGSNYWAFVPKTFDYQPVQDIGINYIESNRVNNYPVVVNPDNIITRSATINMMGVGGADVFPVNNNNQQCKNLNLFYNYNDGRWVEMPWRTSAGYNSDHPYDNVNPNILHNKRLSDIIPSLNLNSNDKSVKITTGSAEYLTISDSNFTVNIDKNIVGFLHLDSRFYNAGYFSQYASPYQNDYISLQGQKDYLIYDKDNNICTVYAYNGVVKYSDSPDKISIVYCDNTNNHGYYFFRLSNLWVAQQYYDMPRAAPFINVEITSYNPADIRYIDITKGYSIKSDNVANVIWDNQYSNGNIQLLFRAENVSSTYQNEILIGDNTIRIDYNDNRFYVKLNDDEPVNIGTWRNIVLEADLVNGGLSAIPVRTFNSYTNVVMDNTKIAIGELTNAQPTNTIEWKPTTNSLTFNVYSTSVFMDTYGVVMVNPSLNITNYFTDLNNFYRLRLYNFTINGDSITINGKTGEVVNNTIVIEEQQILIKDMSITYADGHAYISDSNAEIDLGEIEDNTVSMTGSWYFQTNLSRGYTTEKTVYDWNWDDFILNNVQFCIMYIGIALVGLIIARKFCTISITDYILLIMSFIIALTVQVIA